LVKEIVILKDSGLPLFHYSVDGKQRLDEMVAAFLSAIGTVAQQAGDRQIKMIAFAENKFVWERKGDLYFIALVSLEDSAEIYSVILKELAARFVSMFYGELQKTVVAVKVFRSFADTVEMALQRFDGIPGLARRYKTGLLPVQDFRRIRLSLAETEKHEAVLRGAVMTFDGFIVASTLRAYETEAVLDILPNVWLEGETRAGPQMVSHSSLEPDTSFFVQTVKQRGVCLFVVRVGRAQAEYLKVIQPVLDLVSLTDFDDLKRLNPDSKTESTGFYEFDLVVPVVPTREVLSTPKAAFAGFPKNVHANAMKLLGVIDGKTMFGEVVEKTGLSKNSASEALALLIAKGYVRIAQVFPVMGPRDERFAAYLEIVGMPKKDYAIVDSVWSHCTGGSSIREISDKTRVPASRIVEVLRSLKNHVTWETERVLVQIR